MMYITERGKLSFVLVDWEKTLEFIWPCLGWGSFNDMLLELDTSSFPKGVESKG